MALSSSENIISIKTNSFWQKSTHPFFSIVTPVYNRKEIVKATLKSVKSQTFKDFEYIVIDDGSDSEQSIDTIMMDFMNEADFPVMFIKKQNGGVHTARNAGIRRSRGFLYMAMDSDDEFSKNAFQEIFRFWTNLAETDKKKYSGIISRCRMYNGGMYGKPFPDNINALPFKEALRIQSSLKMESFTILKLEAVKKCMIPEPIGVKFVQESEFWIPFWINNIAIFTNDEWRIYHWDGIPDHLSRRYKKSIQDVRDSVWDSYWQVSNHKQYHISNRKVAFSVFRYMVLSDVLMLQNEKVNLNLPSKYLWMKIFLYIPAALTAIIYKKKRM